MPKGRLDGLTPSERGASEGLERPHVLVRKRGALTFCPSRELIGTQKVKTVQERTAVERGSARIIPARHRRREFEDVGRDQRGIEAKLLGADDEIFVAQVLAKSVERLSQSAWAALVVGVGPEEAEDPFAAHAALTSASQQGEDGEAARLSRCPGERLSIDVSNGEAA